MWTVRRNGEKGDTLIEVLLAMAILSAIIVGAITLMNRGHAIARDSLERSQVTALMTEQAELLRYIRDSYDPSEPGPLVPPASLWEDLTANWTATAEDAGCKANANPFYLQKALSPSGQIEPEIVDFDESTIDGSSSNYVETHAKPGSGLWVEAEPPAGAGGVEYIDFHIKGCWSPSGEGPQQVAKTIVRLYLPTYVAPTFGGGGGGGGACTTIASTFSGDKWVGAAGGSGPTEIALPLNGPLMPGCSYQFNYLWGDYHPGQLAACGSNPCPIVTNQTRESFFIEFLHGGSVIERTPDTGDIPDDWNNSEPGVVQNPNSTSGSEAKELCYFIDIPLHASPVTSLNLKHTYHNTHGLGTNSSHLYGFIFTPSASPC